MKTIGLTGLTGAGKSTVARKLMAYGCYHIDADKVAKDVINNSETAKNKLKEYFGCDVINRDGTTNRPLLASRAFKNEESTLMLNSIVHPEIVEEIKGIIKDMESVGYRGAVVDAIALFESGLADLCDFNVAVVAPLEIRLERIMNRDNITYDKAMERINAQKDEEFFTRQADFVLWNYPPYDINVEIRPIVAQIQI